MPRRNKKRVVIVGNSAAGLSALEAFRKRDQDSKITMIDQERVPAYSRVITPYFILGGVKTEEGLFLRTKDFYKMEGVRAVFGKAVEAIDAKSREVVLDGGKKEPFDLLLIATGSSPNRPRIQGARPEDVFVLRSLADARRLKEIKAKAKKIMFLGGGLVCLQTLQAMVRAGGEYTLVVKSDRVLSQNLDRDASEMVERHLGRMGIRIVKGREVAGLKKGNGSKVAVLDDGQEIETDLVFAGKGVRPNIEFIRGSGIKTNHGILVDGHLEASLSGVYAAGDVAQAADFFTGEKVSYGLWPSAVEQGEIAGKNMAGLEEVYPGNLRWNVTRVFAVAVASIGDVRSERVAETLVRKDDARGIYRKICLDEKGILIGAILVNQAGDLGVIRGLIQARKSGEILKPNSMWRSPINYGLVSKGIIQGRL